jgi:site-specific DNA recombinase
MQRTIIYGRVSTDEQMEKYGMPAQLRACHEYAQSRGLSIIHEITDDGITGMTLDRPGLTRLRDIVARGEMDVVLMLDADRLSRELGHLLMVKPEIEKRARLEFVTGSFENTPTGRLFFSIKGSIAQYERELFLQRTMRGKRERALSGRIVGGRVAYGYRYDAGKLIPDEEQAAIVRRIFDSYLKGMSIRAIAMDLRETGTPTWAGRQWGHSSVRRILINETYAGAAYYGTHRREGNLVRRREDLSGRIPLTVPAIIEREQWSRVQRRLAKNPNVGRPSSTFLLRRLLHCSCGRRMGGERNKGWSGYRCYGRDPFHPGDRCRNTVNADRVDTAVWKAVVASFTDAEVLRSLLAEYQRELQASGPEKVEALKRQVAKCRAREDRCLAILTDPDLPAAAVAVKRKYLEAQKDRRLVEAELESLERAQGRAKSAGEWIEETVAVLKDYIPKLGAAAERQAFVRSLVSRAEWTGQGIALHCIFGRELSQSSRRCDRRPQQLRGRVWRWPARGRR